ncbi:hypothetical protein VNO78_20382 [Psophocarpus tetragonolobus]|uniref:Uncharacterized protein n=1 Tax=Psophocarpus tetragonolobus TaxID=3891 RepID=A0AAN9XHF6_PSOTE
MCICEVQTAICSKLLLLPGLIRSLVLLCASRVVAAAPFPKPSLATATRRQGVVFFSHSLLLVTLPRTLGKCFQVVEGFFVSFARILFSMKTMQFYQHVIPGILFSIEIS